MEHAKPTTSVALSAALITRTTQFKEYAKKLTKKLGANKERETTILDSSSACLSFGSQSSPVELLK